MPFTEDGDSGATSESAVYDTEPTFNPYDPPENPEAIQPTSRPAPSSNAPDFGDTSGTDGEPQSQTAPQGSQEEEEKPPLPEFDPKHREPFEGLLYLGRLQKTFSKWGHTFVIRTLTTEQLAEIGLIVKPYEGTNVENAVYQSAVVAASVQSVDGRPLPGTIEIDRSSELTLVRYPYVLKNWMPSVREVVWQEIFTLELESRQVLEAMGKASG